MIRNAEKNDAQQLSEINFLVMQGFFEKIAANEQEVEEQKKLLQSYIVDDLGSFSFNHVIVEEIDGKIAGAMWIYDAAEIALEEVHNAKAAPTRLPQFLQLKVAEEPEAENGDLYIDTLAVATAFQGQGVASHLLDYAKNMWKKTGLAHLSLIVDTENTHAEMVYLRHGFHPVSMKHIYGHEYKYMQYNN